MFHWDMLAVVLHRRNTNHVGKGINNPYHRFAKRMYEPDRRSRSCIPLVLTFRRDKGYMFHSFLHPQLDYMYPYCI